MPVDWTKPIEFKLITDTVWRPARLVVTDRKNTSIPYLVLTDHGPGCVEGFQWVPECGGGYIRNAPEKKKYQVVVVSGGTGPTAFASSDIQDVKVGGTHYGYKVVAVHTGEYEA